jgi:hypothetical protein
LFKQACGTDLCKYFVVVIKKVYFLAAPLDDVLVALGYDPSGPIKKLTNYQMRSISNKSRVFNIIGTDQEALQLVFDNRNRENLEDKTVYIVNLYLF